MCNSSNNTTCFPRLFSLILLSVSLMVIAGCENDEKEMLIPQVLHLHEKLLNHSIQNQKSG